jgi:hypothetical protein
VAGVRPRAGYLDGALSPSEGWARAPGTAVAPAKQIIEHMSDVRTCDYVFFGQKSGRPMSNMALEMLLRRLKVDATVHGFRSSFRDWVAEQTNVPREVAEAALAPHSREPSGGGLSPVGPIREAPRTDGRLGRFDRWK